MSAVAKLYQDKGWLVTGSDDNFYPPVSTYLKKKKIKYFRGYSPKNIPPGADIIVIGKHAGLTPELNTEVKAAFDSGAPTKSFAEVLGELTKGRINIVIAGSYGKSTCSALIAWILEKSDKKPGYFIGAIPETPRESSTLGKGKYFVIEGDEYPSSNWDASSKFLHYHPDHVLLTSMAHDHLNVFKTPTHYRQPFIGLAGLLANSSTLVACWGNKDNREVLSKLERSVIWYGLDKKNEWRAENIKYGEITSFDLIRRSKKILTLKTRLLGQHNIENIIGISAMILNLKAVSPEQLNIAIRTFKPLARRLDKKSLKTTIPVFEGFGSSREKTKAAIKALKLHFPNKNLIVVFEPHTLSWRNRLAIGWYDDVFKGADKVFIYNPGQSDEDSSQPKTEEIIQRVKKSGVNVLGFEKIQEVIKSFKQKIKNGSMVLVLSSGGFDGFLDSAIPWLEKAFPAK